MTIWIMPFYGSWWDATYFHNNVKIGDLVFIKDNDRYLKCIAEYYLSNENCRIKGFQNIYHYGRYLEITHLEVLILKALNGNNVNNKLLSNDKKIHNKIKKLS